MIDVLTALFLAVAIIPGSLLLPCILLWQLWQLLVRTLTHGRKEV